MYFVGRLASCQICIQCLTCQNEIVFIFDGFLQFEYELFDAFSVALSASFWNFSQVGNINDGMKTTQRLVSINRDILI